MLEKFLVLLERFVVAHELIAANSEVNAINAATENYARSLDKELPVEGEDVIDTPKLTVETVVTNPVTVRAKPKQEEDDLADDEPEDKPKTRKPRATKPKAEPEPDLDKLREEIEVMAKHIGSGDSDDCADELDDLLDEYDARSVKKLKDLQVQEFHKELKAIVAKYYDIEE